MFYWNIWRELAVDSELVENPYKGKPPVDYTPEPAV